MPKNVKLKLTLSDSAIVESNTFSIPDGAKGETGATGPYPTTCEVVEV